MKVILAIIMLLLPLSSFADNERVKPVELGKKGSKDRPRMPQRHSSVECYYENGVISIQFETPEGDATFTVTDVVTGDNASTTFNTAIEFNYFIGTEPSSITQSFELIGNKGNTIQTFNVSAIK